MEMSREISHAKFAYLAVGFWCNVQLGQPVLIFGEEVHKSLVERIAVSAAVQNGGAPVHVYLVSPNEQEARVRNESETLETLRTPPSILQKYAQEIVDKQGALIAITGSERPLGYPDLDPDRIGAVITALNEARAPLGKAILEGKINRCLVPAPTMAWAEQVFPTSPPDDAFKKLERVLFDANGMNATDAVAAFRAQDRILDQRKASLDEMKIQKLHFEGPGTDLEVGLQRSAIWLGGRESTRDERKIEFYGNVPFGEVYTTPNWREVTGVVTISSPLLINKVMVDGIRLAFDKGKLMWSSAERGQEQLWKFLSSDDGASRWGEVALMGIDSPLARENVLYYLLQLDELRGCHFALGDGYVSGIENGATLSVEERDLLGVNRTSNHTHIDFMLSTPKTTVTATSYSGEQTKLIVDGKWTPEFTWT